MRVSERVRANALYVDSSTSSEMYYFFKSVYNVGLVSYGRSSYWHTRQSTGGVHPGFKDNCLTNPKQTAEDANIRMASSCDLPWRWVRPAQPRLGSDLAVKFGRKVRCRLAVELGSW